MKQKHDICANCRFFCQTSDPESRQYFDDRSGECRRHPPRDHFIWTRTRVHHWCGEWSERASQPQTWQKISDHDKSSYPVLLYKKPSTVGQSLPLQSGIIVGYWNAAFNKWHDGADRLFDREDFSHWMPLPDPPKS